MLTSVESVYLDSSAIVKLVHQEPESSALSGWLANYPLRTSATIAVVEVVRAVRPDGPLAVARARDLLRRIELVALSPALLEEASDLGAPSLRSLDAIHLAAARFLGSMLAAIVTYDRRMEAGARALGFPVAAPGRTD